jgi:hypothetical protein
MHDLFQTSEVSAAITAQTDAMITGHRRRLRPRVGGLL